MNSQSNESFETGMANLSLNMHSTPNFSGEWEQDEGPLSTRPLNFIKPPIPLPNKSLMPQDMHIIQDLYDQYGQKVYLEGYLLKKNDLTVDGKSFGDPNWSTVYFELSGPLLTLWDTNDLDEEKVMPQYINIADANVELIGRYNDRENVFSLNSAGANRYFIDAPDFNTLIYWVAAIRLACFECGKLQEIYTYKFITRPIYSDFLSKPSNKTEGLLKVRFPGTTEYQKLWVVVSDRKEEKKLFSKKSVQSKGQMMFYESKKSKTPIMTLNNVAQAYTIFPDSPQSVDLATLLKVEGTNGDEPTSVTLMAASPKELAQWIIGTYDTFKLYGRPSRLLDDPYNPSSLNFAEPFHANQIPRLFLELNDVLHLNYQQDHLLENKVQFTEILAQKLQQQQQQQQQQYRQSQQPMGLINQIPSSGPLINQIPSGQPLINQIPGQQQQMGLINQIPSSGQPMYNQQQQRMSGMPPSQQQQQQARSNVQQQQQPSINRTTGRVIYASDDDSEDSESEVGEDDESDRDSGYKVSKNMMTRESLSLPTMSTEDDGFANSILGNIEKKSVASSIKHTSIHSSNPSLTPKKAPELSDTEDDEEDDDDEEGKNPRVQQQGMARRPKPKMTKTQVSLSGSDEEEDDDEEEVSGSDDDDVPIQQQQQQRLQQQQQQQQQNYQGYDYDEYGNPIMMNGQQQQQWEQGMMMSDMYPQTYYDEDGYPIIDEDGPVIPQLGDRFATQNSLLDSYRPDRPSAHDQEGYARATGQPLIQVPNKPPEPRAGLVGMISQIENEKKHKESNKSRFTELDKERMMERERNQFMMDQRSQMMPMMGQQMMYPGMMQQNPAMMNMQMMGGQMPMMMNPRMSMMYPGMMQQNPAMMNMQMMGGQLPMMDPRMSMMMMQQQYGQYPMWNGQQPMYGNNRFNGHIEEDDDEDDDVPLGAKESPIPRHN